MNTDIKIQAMDQVGKGSIAVAGSLLSTLTSSNLLTFLTIVYVALQGAYLLWRWYHEFRERQRNVKAEQNDNTR